MEIGSTGTTIKRTKLQEDLPSWGVPISQVLPSEWLFVMKNEDQSFTTVYEMTEVDIAFHAISSSTNEQVEIVALEDTFYYQLECILKNLKFKRYKARSLNGQKSILNLGEVPIKSGIKGQHGNSKKLPPCVKLENYVCVHKDLTRKALTGLIQTHILRGGPSCNAEAELRILVNEKKFYYYAISFFKESFQHTCPQEIHHRAPLTPQEVEFLIRMHLKFGTPKDVFEKVIAPLVNTQALQNLTSSRLLKMNESELNKFAVKFGLDQRVKPGQQDFAEVHRILECFANAGAATYIKLPGQDSESCKTIPNEIKPLLAKKDLFIFNQYPHEQRICARFGHRYAIGIDATHGTVGYNKVKLIVGSVASSCEDPKVRERGFPVCLVITTSETTEIHAAVVTCLRLNQACLWDPGILMSDMAFGAIVAWQQSFPSIKWLFCKFHVWQAVCKRIKQTPRPNELKQDEFNHLKGHVLKEVKFLINPERELSWEEFDERLQLLIDVLWVKNLDSLASYFEFYSSRKKMWAPPARRDATNQVYGLDKEIPMLVKTNNLLERLFGIIKHILLKGKASLTISNFLNIWNTYGANVKINATNAGVYFNQVLPINRNENPENDLEFDLEGDNQEEDEDDEENPNFEKSMLEEEDYNSNPGEEEDLGEMKGEEKTDPNNQPLIKRLSYNKLISSPNHIQIIEADINSLQNKLNQLKLKRNDDNVLKTISSQLKKLNKNFDAALELDDVEMDELGGISKITPFIKQRDNFGSTQIDEEIIQSCLFKAKRKKPNKQSVVLEFQTFKEYSLQITSQPGFNELVEQCKKNFSKSDYPILRMNLEKNTVIRMRGIALSILSINTSKSIQKQKLVDLIISKVHETFNLNEELQISIGDIGILKADEHDLAVKGDIVLLKVNSSNNLGQNGVSVCDNLVCLLLQDGEIKEASVEEFKLTWGRLSEFRKDLSDL
jgi:hypothetical protein